MISYFIKLISKLLLYFFLWVAILSFEWNGRTFFDHAHEHFIENTLVTELSSSMSDFFGTLKDHFQESYANFKQSKKKEIEKI